MSTHITKEELEALGATVELADQETAFAVFNGDYTSLAIVEGGYLVDCPGVIFDEHPALFDIDEIREAHYRKETE